MKDSENEEEKGEEEECAKKNSLELKNPSYVTASISEQLFSVKECGKERRERRGERRSERERMVASSRFVIFGTG